MTHLIVCIATNLTNHHTNNNNCSNGGGVTNYYHHLDPVDGEVNGTSASEQVAVDEAGEKMLTGEIQKFRQRQLQRDK